MATTVANACLCHHLGTRGNGNDTVFRKGRRTEWERNKERTRPLVRGAIGARLLPLVKVQD